MKFVNKILIVLVILGGISIMFFSWYMVRHSMDEAKVFEVNSAARENHILIATQGSKFKDEVVAQVIRQLPNDLTYIKVIDVSSLPDITENDWHVIVILHTWEYSKPPPVVKSFVDKLSSKDKLIVISTSGDGTYRIKDVDAITSASQLDEVTGKAKEIVLRIEEVLTSKNTEKE